MVTGINEISSPFMGEGVLVSMIMFAIFLLSPDSALESKVCCCRKAMIVLKLGMLYMWLCPVYGE